MCTRPSTGPRHVEPAPSLRAGSPVVAQRRLLRTRQMNVPTSPARRRFSALRTQHEAPFPPHSLPHLHQERLTVPAPEFPGDRERAIPRAGESRTPARQPERPARDLEPEGLQGPWPRRRLAFPRPRPPVKRVRGTGKAQAKVSDAQERVAAPLWAAWTAAAYRQAGEPEGERLLPAHMIARVFPAQERVQNPCHQYGGTGSGLSRGPALKTLGRTRLARGLGFGPAQRGLGFACALARMLPGLVLRAALRGARVTFAKLPAHPRLLSCKQDGRPSCVPETLSCLRTRGPYSGLRVKDLCSLVRATVPPRSTHSLLRKQHSRRAPSNGVGTAD